MKTRSLVLLVSLLFLSQANIALTDNLMSVMSYNATYEDSIYFFLQSNETPSNLDEMQFRYGLPDSAIEQLLAKKVLVYPKLNSCHIGFSYFHPDSPIIVTTDAWLHLMHVIHDDLLKTIEFVNLSSAVEVMVKELQASSNDTYNMYLGILTNITAAAKANVIYSSVACQLLDPLWPVPSYVEAEVMAIVEKIIAHNETQVFPGEDYTQYEPRGHYAGNSTLEAYFRCMKWLGRRIFFVENYNPDIAPLHTRQIVLLANALNGSIAGELWQKVFNITSRFVGYPDSITPIHIQQGAQNVLGEDFTVNAIEAHLNITKLWDEFAKPEYPTPVIFPFIDPMSPLEIKYAQLMGERWIPDSAAYQETTGAHRRLPMAMETVYTIMGSERALEIVLESEAPENRGALEITLHAQNNEFSVNYTQEDWVSNTYMNWLFMLEPLAENFTDTYPEFMKTPAWKDEKLNTILGSYTQLRHDYILYAKQGVSGYSGVTSNAIVEPIPEFYCRLHGLFNQLHLILDDIDMLDNETDHLLTDLQVELNAYQLMAQKILDGIPLNQTERRRITDWGEWPGELANQDPRLVADIWTAGGSGEVLEEGVGPFNKLFIIFEAPGGEPLIYGGYVFSYYEFNQTDYQRLTNDEWKTLILTDPPDRPWWTNSFLWQPEPIVPPPVGPPLAFIITLAVIVITLITLSFVILRRRTS